MKRSVAWTLALMLAMHGIVYSPPATSPVDANPSTLYQALSLPACSHTFQPLLHRSGIPVASVRFEFVLHRTQGLEEGELRALRAFAAGETRRRGVPVDVFWLQPQTDLQPQDRIYWASQATQNSETGVWELLEEFKLSLILDRGRSLYAVSVPRTLIQGNDPFHCKFAIRREGSWGTPEWVLNPVMGFAPSPISFNNIIHPGFLEEGDETGLVRIRQPDCTPWAVETALRLWLLPPSHTLRDLELDAEQATHRFGHVGAALVTAALMAFAPRDMGGTSADRAELRQTLDSWNRHHRRSALRADIDVGARLQTQLDDLNRRRDRIAAWNLHRFAILERRRQRMGESRFRLTVAAHALRMLHTTGAEAAPVHNLQGRIAAWLQSEPGILLQGTPSGHQVYGLPQDRAFYLFVVEDVHRPSAERRPWDMDPLLRSLLPGVRPEGVHVHNFLDRSMRPVSIGGQRQAGSISVWRVTMNRDAFQLSDLIDRVVSQFELWVHGSRLYDLLIAFSALPSNAAAQTAMALKAWYFEQRFFPERFLNALPLRNALSAA